MSALSACARAARGFSAADDVVLFDLAEADEAMRAIANDLGRDVNVVVRRFNDLMAELEPAERKAFHARRCAALARIARAKDAAPPKLVLEARRRDQARAGSLDAVIFGDPPPGYSARDGRVGMV